MPEQEDAGVSLEEALAFAAAVMKKGHLEAAAETYRRILGVAPDLVDAWADRILAGV